MSGGVVYAGGGTALQKALGVHDSEEQMYRFLSQAGALHPPLEKIQLYCEGSVEHFDWLVAQGVPYTQKLTLAKGLPMGDESLYYSGTELAWPARDLATPAPRGHVPRMQNKKQGESSAGFMLMKGLVDTATGAGARSLYDVRVQSLITESDGRVVGIRTRRYGTTMDIRARRGVVLATGSFAYNDAMVAQYAPRIAGRPAASIEQHDGQAIRMAQALGADLAHMDATEVALFIDPQQLVRAFW